MLYHVLIEEHLTETSPILEISGKKYTYQGLHNLAGKFYAYLCSKQIKKGDKVVIIAKPDISTVTAILGCIYSGVVFVPIDSMTGEEDRKNIVDETSAKLVIEDFSVDKLQTSDENIHERIFFQKNEKVYILYTSGSSSKPKGVIGSINQILFCVERINKRLQNHSGDRILSALPLSFDYGLYQIFLSFYSGAVLYLEDGRILQRLIAILRKKQITAFPVVPSMLHCMYYSGLFHQVELPYLRYICTTGDVLNLRVVEKIHGQFPGTEIIPMYGLTECKRVSVMPFGCLKKTLAGSCGLPLDDITVKLLNKDAEGKGELIVIGGNVMEGYNSQDEEGGFFVDSQTKQKGIFTGDLFKIDMDGFLYFCGRIKRIIKCRGYRISNAKIEEFFLKIDCVNEARAEGIQDELLGERIGVAIYGDVKQFEEIESEFMKTIPQLYRPHILYLSTKPLPKNVNGKFDDKEITRKIIEVNSR